MGVEAYSRVTHRIAAALRFRISVRETGEQTREAAPAAGEQLAPPLFAAVAAAVCTAATAAASAAALTGAVTTPLLGVGTVAARGTVAAQVGMHTVLLCTALARKAPTVAASFLTGVPETHKRKAAAEQAAAAVAPAAVPAGAAAAAPVAAKRAFHLLQ